MPGDSFGLLGPVSYRDGEDDRSPRRPRVRTLLALLVVEPNREVSTDTLVSELWADRPPTTARTALHVHVRALREVLRPGLAGNDPEQPLGKTPTGYVLRVDPDRCDVTTATAWGRQGIDELGAGRADRAATSLRAALDLWRGAALADVDTPVLRTVHAPAMEELRLTLLEHLAAAELELGRHDAVVSLIAEHSVRHPLRERAAAHLIRALVHTGRRAEALLTFERTRKILATELGVDPGVELMSLHSSIVRGTEVVAGYRAG